jgi:two-component system OmpR family response regulator
VKECAQLARSERFDGIVIDFSSFLFTDGLTLMTFLRMENPQAAIFVISTGLDLHQRLRLFEAGIDDCMGEPFFAAELTVRLRHAVQLRQAAADFAAAHEVSLLRCGDLELDLVRRKVVRAGKLIDLRPKEFLLLEYLARNVNRPVTRTMILEHVWSSSFEGLTNVVDVYINAIRNKLDRDFTDKLIQTYRGIGYSLVLPSLIPAEVSNDGGATK